MTTVFRSCLPRFHSTAHQSLSFERLSARTTSLVSLKDEHADDDSMDSLSISVNDDSLAPKSTTTCPLHSSPSDDGLINDEVTTHKPCQPEQRSVSHPKSNPTSRRTKKRGPRYSRVNADPPPLLTRLVDTIFGDSRLSSQSMVKQSQTSAVKKKRTVHSTKKSVLPSPSTIKKQFDENEKTLRSLVTLLAQIESNVQLTTTSTPLALNGEQPEILSAQKEQARNNNRMDDTSSSHSSDSYQHKSKAKSSHQQSSTSKRCVNNRSTRKYRTNKRKQADDDTLSSSSLATDDRSQSMPSHRRKMIDSQQQTHIYPMKTNMATSTQCNHASDAIVSEPSWLDVMREDQTTSDAWARIRRRLKPNQQKDILRALMIICANLFEVPMENKQS